MGRGWEGVKRADTQRDFAGRTKIRPIEEEQDFQPYAALYYYYLTLTTAASLLAGPLFYDQAFFSC